MLNLCDVGYIQDAAIEIRELAPSGVQRRVINADGSVAFVNNDQHTI